MISKSNLLWMAAISTILCSCSVDDSLEHYQNEVPVSETLKCQLSLNLSQSRVTDTTAGFYDLYYAVYEKTTGNLVLSNVTGPQKLETSSEWQDIEIPLEMYEDAAYDVALWAHPESAGFAEVADLQNIKISYNKESPIAYSTHMTVTADQSSVKGIVLNNPFSRWLIHSSEKDAEGARNACYDFTQITAELELTEIGTSYNALTSTINGTGKILFANGNLENNDFEPEGSKLLMDVSFLPVGHNHDTGILTVSTDNGQTVLRATTFGNMFFKSDNIYETEGIYLGYPIDFDITVGDWYVNSETITLD